MRNEAVEDLSGSDRSSDMKIPNPRDCLYWKDRSQAGRLFCDLRRGESRYFERPEFSDLRRGRS